MSFLVYLFVLLVAASSVVFGLDWMQAPLQPPSYADHAQHASPAPKPPVKTAAAKPAPVPPAPASAPAAAETTASATTAVPVAEGESTPADTQQEAKATPAPLCDIAACETAYQSFTPADCTYQPFDGPRRLCKRGNPPSRHGAMLAAAEARAQAGCNVSACASAYQSFDPATCTYQPYDGPRRLCTK